MSDDDDDDDDDAVYDTTRSSDGEQSSSSSESDEISSARPPPPPINKKRQFRVEYQGQEAITKVAAAVNKARKTGEPLNTDVFIPAPSLDLLHNVSLKELPKEKLEMTIIMTTVVRECERIAAGIAEPSLRDLFDLRRMLRVYDDFALTNIQGGIKIDKRHRLGLFITRMKIISALTTLEAQFPGRVDQCVRNHYWTEAKRINNLELAKWMYENKACHPLMLVVERRLPRTHPNFVAGHLIEHSTLECFWQSLLMFAAAWPTMSMSPYVVAMFDAMRARAAFFMSYRELASSGDGGAFSLQSQMERSRTKILGLNLNLFGVSDLNNPGAEQPSIQPQDNQSTLLDNVDLVKTTGNHAHVNLDFAEESDRLLHAMQLNLRQAAGFRHKESLTCICCSERRKISEANVKLLEQLVSDQLIPGKGTGIFRTQITEEFREMLFDFYDQPDELASFKEYHGFEVITAQNCISQKRSRDYQALVDAYITETADLVWGRLVSKRNEPAYGLLVMLAMNYFMQQEMRGARISQYYIDVSKSDGGIPFFPYTREMEGEARKTGEELHVKLTTTGTFLFRNKLLQQTGMLSSKAEIEYQHPLIVRSMNSFAILHNGHMHECQSFSHAFLLWLSVMCVDRAIEGQMATGSFLHPLFLQLFPDRQQEIYNLSESAQRRMREYDPLNKFVARAIQDTKHVVESNGMTQF